MTRDRKAPWILIPATLLAGFAIFVFSPLAYRPDRPVPTIVPGAQAGPAFVVQIIRPRLGLPFGGLLPPRLFGLDEHLGFESTSAGASVDQVDPGRIQLSAEDWKLDLVLDAEGRVSPETEVVFQLVFRDRLRTVRCRPAEPAVGTVEITSPDGALEWSGHFHIELARSADARTGKPLGWPTKPLVLHGSFDQLPVGQPAKAR